MNSLPPAKKGFTLIELLIVIVIIAILASLAFAVYGKAQKGIRDEKRKADLNTIATALEIYFQKNGAYPQSDWVNSTGSGYWLTSLNSSYIDSMPKDPINTGCPSSSSSVRDNSNCFAYGYYSGGWCGLSGKTFILVTRLEADNTTQYSQKVMNPNDGSCTVWSESPVSGLYVLTSP